MLSNYYPFMFSLDAATIIASYLEPNQLHFLRDFSRLRYDAKKYSINKIPNWVTLTSLTIRLSTNLTNVSPQYLRSIVVATDITDDILSFLQQATSVTCLIISCIDIPSLTHFPKLETLKLHLCPNTDKLNTITHCPKLKELSINKCGATHIPQSVTNLHNLKIIVIVDTLIINYAPLFECRNLRYIGLKNIKVMYDLAKPTCRHLKKLLINDTQITNLSAFSFCSKLKHLFVGNCPNITSLPAFPKCKKLTIWMCGISDVNFLHGYHQITHLTLVDCKINNGYTFKLPNIRVLEIKDCSFKSNLDFHTERPSITIIRNSKQSPYDQRLWFENIDRSQDVRINGYNNLNSLNHYSSNATILVIRNSTTENIDVLAKCKKLTALEIRDCNRLKSLNILAQCPLLYTLLIANCGLLDLSPLKECNNLKTIAIDDFDNTPDLSILPQCKTIYKIGLTNLNDFSSIPICDNIKHIAFFKSNCLDISELSKWENLTHLELENCTKLTVLPICRKLKEIYIRDCPELIDISALYQCDELVKLEIIECAHLDTNTEVANLMARVNARQNLML